MKFFKQSNLKNFSVLSEQQPNAYSVSFGIWIKLGSADESINGLSHFYEHMAFKGTDNNSAYDLAYAIENCGGDINAYTCREYTCFYVKVAKEDFTMALEILCDMINNSTIDLAEVNKERDVIIEEIKSYDDAADEYVLDLFTQALWGDCALAKPIAGTEASVAKISQTDLFKHIDLIFKKAPMVFAAIGDVDHQFLVDKVSTLLTNKQSYENKSRAYHPCHNQVILQETKDIQQCHVVLGTCLEDQPQILYPLALLNLILGDGMSSRLFQKIREERGLAYSIYSSVDNYEANRVFSIYLAADYTNTLDAISLIKQELENLFTQGILEEELAFAKRNLLGSLHIAMDIPTNRLNRLAQSMIRYNRVVSIKEIEDQVNAISIKDVNTMAKNLLKNYQWAGSVVYPTEAKPLDFDLNFKV